MNPQPIRPGLIKTLAPERGAGRNVRAPWLAWPLCVLCVVLALTGLILTLLNGYTLREIFVGDIWVTIAVTAVAYSFVGALIASRRPGNPIGWIFCFAALSQGLLIFAEAYATYALLTRPGTLPLGAEAVWLSEWIWAPGVGLFLVFLPLLFPDGRPPTRRWWWVAWLGGLSIGLISVLGAVLFWPDRGPELMRYGDGEAYVVAPVWALMTDYVAFPMMLVAGLGAVVSLFVRFRRARGEERQQIKWFASAAALTLGYAFVLDGLPEDGPLEAYLPVAGLLIVPSVPVATAIAILKYRLYDIDLVINRTLVYGVLTACVVGIYVLVVGYLGALFRTADNLLISLVATGVVAVLFAPLRDRLQRAINHLMYGERDDPYAVISRLGQRLETTLAPGAVLPAVVQTVKEALKLPYAAISLDDNGVPTQIAAGEPVEKPLRLPLAYRNEPVGELVLGPRAGEGSFSSTDLRLLEDLARQAGVAAHAVRLTNDLQRSRERLVTAREEERRRLRRDLHDGLGPTLGSLPLKLDIADDLVTEDPAAARELLRGLKAQARSAVTDIRHLVYELRPPTLDDLGLVGALHEITAQHDAGGPRISAALPKELPPLPAAAEVAAYRIVQEALANVVRHAAASECTVSLSFDEESGTLRLEIEDDGRGISEDRGTGVGIHSMRERAEELGGRCVVGSPPGSGTRVYASLPVTSPAPEGPSAGEPVT